MTFVKIPGLKGKVFVPQESGPGFKKMPCKDCYSCQQCSDDRCRVCRGQRACGCEPQAVNNSQGSEADPTEKNHVRSVGKCRKPRTRA